MSVSEQQCRLPYFSRTDSEGQARLRAIGNKRRIKVQIGAPKCRKLWGFLLIFHCNFVIPMANTQESSTAFSRLSRQVYLQVAAVIWQVFSLLFCRIFSQISKRLPFIYDVIKNLPNSVRVKLLSNFKTFLTSCCKLLLSFDKFSLSVFAGFFRKVHIDYYLRYVKKKLVKTQWDEIDYPIFPGLVRDEEVNNSTTLGTDQVVLVQAGVWTTLQPHRVVCRPLQIQVLRLCHRRLQVVLVPEDNLD